MYSLSFANHHFSSHIFALLFHSHRYETLSGGDCSVLKTIMKTRRDCEYGEASAMSCVAAGMGKFDLMTGTAEVIAAEDPFAFYDGGNAEFGE